MICSGNSSLQADRITYLAGKVARIRTECFRGTYSDRAEVLSNSRAAQEFLEESEPKDCTLVM